MIKINKKIIINLAKIFLLLFFCSIFSCRAYASEFLFNTEKENVSINERFKVNLLLNTNKEYINAIESEITIPVGLDLVEIDNYDSIINFWIEEPVFINQKVRFSGIIPGGYISDDGRVVSLVLIAKQTGQYSVGVENAKVLKNDGKGSITDLSFKNLKIVVGKSTVTENGTEVVNTTSSTPINNAPDLEAPEAFSPEYGRDGSMFNGKWFVVFTTKDTGSGIERYEVKESRNMILSFLAKWKTIDSPYVLDDQSLNSYIYIKAVDKNGNVRIVKLEPKNKITWYANYENWIIILVVLMVFCILKKCKYKK